MSGLERVAATSATHSPDWQGVAATCPSGKGVLGAGADITGGEGQVVLDDVSPSSTLTYVFALGFEDQDGTTANWSITAYAICANVS